MTRRTVSPPPPPPVWLPDSSRAFREAVNSGLPRVQSTFGSHEITYGDDASGFFGTVAIALPEGMTVEVMGGATGVLAGFRFYLPDPYDQDMIKHLLGQAIKLGYLTGWSEVTRENHDDTVTVEWRLHFPDRQEQANTRILDTTGVIRWCKKNLHSRNVLPKQGAIA